MFGTIARMTVQAGKEAEFQSIGEQWMQERGANVGQVAGYVFKLKDRPGEYAVVGVFTDEQTYYANAADPETDRWYRMMRETLATDPEWSDGEVVQTAVLAGI